METDLPSRLRGILAQRENQLLFQVSMINFLFDARKRLAVSSSFQLFLLGRARDLIMHDASPDEISQLFGIADGSEGVFMPGTGYAVETRMLRAQLEELIGDRDSPPKQWYSGMIGVCVWYDDYKRFYGRVEGLQDLYRRLMRREFPGQ
ncbi:MAG: hypothetical protein V1735_02285 [Nanoarchaeota archaeon]